MRPRKSSLDPQNEGALINHNASLLWFSAPLQGAFRAYRHERKPKNTSQKKGMTLWLYSI
ncbi:hypothetical protein FACS1894208_05870 [Clostridia bacterium]|nr:hypothetical protein FACS1894208_05870 [Clostridia bacterium]